MKKQTMTYEDAKKMHPEYPYAVATLGDVPVWLCKTREDALGTKEDAFRLEARALKVVDLRYL